MAESDTLARLRAENARLIALLEAHGIESRLPPEPSPPASTPDISKRSTQEKVTLFRRLFRGRDDVYPVRWESKTSGKSGYTLACANEWRDSVCDKRRVKCANCSNRQLLPLSDSVIYDHLAGKHRVGVYLCWRTTPAVFWRLILMRPNGVLMRVP